LFEAGLQIDLSGINSVMVPKIAMPPTAVFVAEGAPSPALRRDQPASPLAGSPMPHRSRGRRHQSTAKLVRP
jgi:hypothetical protein